MLYNASDYKFVNVAPVANRIHGNIMPIINPTSSTAQIYFENYLFFLEAFYERYNVEQEGQNTIGVPVRTLDAENMYALNIKGSSFGVANGAIRGPQLGYGNDVTYYVSPDTTYPQSHVNTGYTEDSTYHIYDFLQNAQLQCPEEKAPYYAMRPYKSRCPQTLLSDFIRVKFWTFQHMRKLLIPIRWGDFATSAVNQILNPDGSVNYQSDINLGTTTESYIRGYSTTSDGHGGSVEYQNFRTVLTYKQSFFTFPYATSATLIWKCSAYPIGDSSSNQTKYVWSAKQLSVVNGAIRVPADMIETLCNDTCLLSGYGSNSTIGASPFYLLVDFEFPARLNGVNWNWQPTYTS